MLVVASGWMHGPETAAGASVSAQEWLDTIRVPLRSEGSATMRTRGMAAGRTERAAADRPSCPGVGAVAFETGGAEPSEEGRRTMDALATALTSADLADSSFEVMWLAPDAAGGGVAERRAGAVEAGLRANPGLPPARLTMKPASAFEDCPQSPPPNTLPLKVRIAGRWWGGR